MMAATSAVWHESALNQSIVDRYLALTDESPRAQHCTGEECWGTHAIGVCLCGCPGCVLALELLVQAEDDELSTVATGSA